MLSIGIALCAGTAGFHARAGGVGVHICLPFFSFGIGLGLGFPCAAQVYGCAAPVYTCASPVYACARPMCGNYACSAPAYYDPPEQAVASIDPIVRPAPMWVPSTPGAGHWVPDPQPYNCTPHGFGPTNGCRHDHHGHQVGRRRAGLYREPAALKASSRTVDLSRPEPNPSSIFSTLQHYWVNSPL